MSENNNYLLLEGKRDNQLLPYLQAFNEKTGSNLSLGNFKTMMLRKLSTEGGMHNISLQSNYYLVGAVKYYFQGLLTTNQELGVFTDSADAWNVKVCTKLNALILVLRNGYIDSIGTTWVEPEDFGEMNLKDLFTKYNKEIRKILAPAKKSNASEEVVADYEMSNANYTYDIIYNFHDSSKYEQDTAPGSWCITYGNNHLQHYTSRGNGHFVIFRKNGYKEVPRKAQKEKWIGNKPQDDYGNSLIAYLQDNNSPGPANYGGAPLITSRWNHGYGGIFCEADRAYTQKEFQKITGVSDEDLKGIYDTWKKNRSKRSDGRISAKVRKVTADEVRQLKYIQMRINGGEKPEDLIRMPGDSIGKYNIPCICDTKINETLIYFLFFNKKIYFETAVVGDLIHTFKDTQTLTFFYNENISRYFILNKRTKNILNIEGQWNFKAVVEMANLKNNEDTDMFIEVKMANLEIALVDLLSGIPLKLPNGHYWFNRILSNSSRYGNVSMQHGQVTASARRKYGLYEITYDLSSGEKYFYCPKLKKFVNFGDDNSNMYVYNSDIPGDNFIFMIEAQGYPRTDYGYCFPNVVGMSKQYIYTQDCVPTEIVFSLQGITYKIGDNGPRDAQRISFDKIRGVGCRTNFDVSSGFIIVPVNITNSKFAIMYNVIKKEILKDPYGNIFYLTRDGFSNSYYNAYTCEYLLMLKSRDSRSAYFFNMLTNSYVRNPYNSQPWSNSYLFEGYTIHGLGDSRFVIRFTINDSVDNNEPNYYDDIRVYREYWLDRDKKTKRYYDYKNDRFLKDIRTGYNDALLLVPDEDVSNTENTQQEEQPNYNLTEHDIVKMVNKTISLLSEINKKGKK